MEKQKLVILGGGLAALSAAWVLSKKNYAVTIIEKSTELGGLAVTRKKDKYYYDLGPHNIHTVHAHILKFLQKNLAHTMFAHKLTSKILKRSRFIDYPLKGIRVLSSLPIWKIPIAGLSFLCARICMFLRNPAQDSSFEDWIKNRFGKVLYKEYFGGYAGKVWGIHPKQIDCYVAEKRVPILGLMDLLRALLFGKPPKREHPETTDQCFYLKMGIGEMVDFFVDGIKKQGVQIIYNANIQSIASQSDKINSISFIENNQSLQSIDCDQILSTIPLNEFIGYLENAPTEVKQSASELDYCSTLLVYIVSSKQNIFPAKMLYFSDPKNPISRVYDVGSYSKHMVPEGKTLLCAELPCNYQDNSWNQSDESLAKTVQVVFEKSELLQAEDIEDAFVEKISHSYPRFRLDFQARLKNCFDHISSLKNCISYGRQGSFAYLNTDGVVHQGFIAANAVMSAEELGYSNQEWFDANIKK